MENTPEKNLEMTQKYDASDIQVLEGLDAVRKRPGMYIGSTGPQGLHHLVYEIVDNAIDEVLAGHCTKILVDLLPGDIVRVKDNGRGIPVGIQPKLGIPAVTVVFSVQELIQQTAYRVVGIVVVALLPQACLRLHLAI